jgi:hypothetical protein
MRTTQSDEKQYIVLYYKPKSDPTVHEYARRGDPYQGRKVIGDNTPQNRRNAAQQQQLHEQWGYSVSFQLVPAQLLAQVYSVALRALYTKHWGKKHHKEDPKYSPEAIMSLLCVVAERGLEIWVGNTSPVVAHIHIHRKYKQYYHVDKLCGGYTKPFMRPESPVPLCSECLDKLDNRQDADG